MSDDKKSLPQLRGLVERPTRIILLFWAFIITLGAITRYLRPVLPWIAGTVAALFIIWMVVAIIRWRRSRW